MADELTRTDQFLLKEYETAAQLTYHIDTLRDRLTAFFVTVTGIAVAGLSIVLKGETNAQTVSLATGVSATLFIVVAVLGGLVVAILARLRRAQIEHFRIMNNVREHFLGDELKLWDVVELSNQTLPTPNRRSGTFMWLALILVVSGFAAGLGVYVIVHDVIEGASNTLAWALAVVAFTMVPGALQALYLKLRGSPGAAEIHHVAEAGLTLSATRTDRPEAGRHARDGSHRRRQDRFPALRALQASNAASTRRVGARRPTTANPRRGTGAALRPLRMRGLLGDLREERAADVPAPPVSLNEPGCRSPTGASPVQCSRSSHRRSPTTVDLIRSGRVDEALPPELERAVRRKPARGLTHVKSRAD